MDKTIQILQIIHDNSYSNMHSFEIFGDNLPILVNSYSIEQLIENSLHKLLPLHKDYKPENFSYLIGLAISLNEKEIETNIRLDAKRYNYDISEEEIVQHLEIKYLIDQQNTILIKNHKEFVPSNFPELFKYAISKEFEVAKMIFNESINCDTPIDLVTVLLKFDSKNLKVP